ncbi:hypothetical protein K461DRAFT_270896 [Myriangium duriaei CBS 260.36]|uniref:Uncharacterized protein n=1 Tax=Myriangium duriaei CBS 260.36 TaxID=1168546 RepID=A0A9P4IVK6_9PEZI|nr:hypothetical protein K461DRAFT_270896 [Myriangium duriaei CBS 260.36]
MSQNNTQIPDLTEEHRVSAVEAVMQASRESLDRQAAFLQTVTLTTEHNEGVEDEEFSDPCETESPSSGDSLSSEEFQPVPKRDPKIRIVHKKGPERRKRVADLKHRAPTSTYWARKSASTLRPRQLVNGEEEGQDPEPEDGFDENVDGDSDIGVTDATAATTAGATATTHGSNNTTRRTNATGSPIATSDTTTTTGTTAIRSTITTTPTFTSVARARRAPYTREIWSQAETNKIHSLIRAGCKRAKVADESNRWRVANGMPPRPVTSIWNKRWEIISAVEATQRPSSR